MVKTRDGEPGRGRGRTDQKTRNSVNYTLAAVEPHRDSTGLSLGVRLACSSGQDTLGLQIRFWCLVCISSPAQPSADVKHSPFLNFGKANGPSSIRGRDSRRVGRPAAAGNGPGWISSVRTGQERARNELAAPLWNMFGDREHWDYLGPLLQIGQSLGPPPGGCSHLVGSSAHGSPAPAAVYRRRVRGWTATGAVRER